jgi:HEPN domain-containing protein
MKVKRSMPATIAKEWVEKAEGDFATASREWRARKRRNHDAVCFHAQQCIEKYLKALLQEHCIAFTKTHDLVVLLKALLKEYPLWSGATQDMDVLSRFAVLFRYPGESATREDAQRAMVLMRKYRYELRHALGLKME